MPTRPTRRTDRDAGPVPGAPWFRPDADGPAAAAEPDAAGPPPGDRDADEWDKALEVLGVHCGRPPRLRP